MRRWSIATVAALALITQLASATWWVKPYPMPNAALVIGYRLAVTGRYEGGSWLRLKGRTLPDDPPLQSYHLPGEPLYLAGGLALDQPSVFRYWHVPIAVLLVVATALAATALFGRPAGVFAGTVAALDPVTVLHGPVYDDAFLGAALLWTVVAVLAQRQRAASRPGQWAVPPWSAVPALVLVIAAGWGAVTRAETLIALAALAVGAVAVRALRPIRQAGILTAAAAAITVGAWTARNVAVQHHLLLGTTHDGLTLWESTAPQAARAIALGQVDALAADPAVVGPLWRQTQDLDEVGADRAFFRAAIRDIVAEPTRVVGLGVRKVLLSVAGVRPELALTSLRNVVSIVAMIGLAAAAGYGWRRAAASPDPVRRVAAAAACLLGLELLGVLALGPVGLRYWIAGRPVLWLLAGNAAASLWTIDRHAEEARAVST